MSRTLLSIALAGAVVAMSAGCCPGPRPCCPELGARTRSDRFQGVSGEIELLAACRDPPVGGCFAPTTPEGFVRALDGGPCGREVARVELVPDGTFELPLPEGHFFVEVAVYGTHVDRSLGTVEIGPRNGFRIWRRYGKFTADRGLYLEGSVPAGADIRGVGPSRGYYRLWEGVHPQLEGERLTAKYPEITGFKLGNVFCPGSASAALPAEPTSQSEPASPACESG